MPNTPIKDLIVGEFKKNIGKIARKAGRSEKDVESAFEKGKNGTYAMARELGLTQNVARDIIEYVRPIARKIPFLGEAILDSEAAKILPGLDDDKPRPNREQRRAGAKKTSGFDRSKYKRV
ncbi:MAG: hypothetical protein FWC77_01655 [Defluviitaleaceae bacterium]|nr:hypothetical protein [Defluviitaleaceae bacterium]